MPLLVLPISSTSALPCYRLFGIILIGLILLLCLKLDLKDWGEVFKIKNKKNLVSLNALWVFFIVILIFFNYS